MTAPILKPGAPVVTVMPDPGASLAGEFEKGAEAAFTNREVTAKELKEVIAPSEKSSDKPADSNPDLESKFQDPSDFKPGTKAKQWDQLKESKKAVEGELESYKGQLADLRAKLSSYEKHPKPDEFEKLRTERDDLADRLKSVAIERHPDTEKKYNHRMQSALELGKTAVPVEQAEGIARLLAQPDSDSRSSALDEILLALTPTRKAKLERAIADVDATYRDYREEVQNSRQNWQKIQQQKVHEESAIQSQREEALHTVLARWSDPEKGLAVFHGTDDESKSAIERAKSLAKDLAVGFEKLGATDRAKASAWAAAAPLILRDNLSKTEHIAKLESELEKLRSGGPSGEERGEVEVPKNGKEDVLSWGNFASEIERQGIFPNR